MLGQQERRVTYVLSLRIWNWDNASQGIDHKCYGYTKKYTQKNCTYCIFTAAKSDSGESVGLGALFNERQLIIVAYMFVKNTREKSTIKSGFVLSFISLLKRQNLGSTISWSLNESH